MRYALLINKNEEAWDKLDEAGRAAWLKRYAEWGNKAVAAGVMRGGAILEHTPSATTVRKREGKILVSDGPFVETTEQVAGVAFIEVANLDAALEWAASHPDAEWGSVEVRPIVPLKDHLP